MNSTSSLSNITATNVLKTRYQGTLTNMRTVDPELWSKKLKKPAMQVSRRMRFGQQAGCRLEQRLRDSLRDALADFWRSCSVAAVKYINASATSCERSDSNLD